MNKEQVLIVCDDLIDQITVIKGFAHLSNVNRKVDHSMNIIREAEILEEIVKKLVDTLVESIEGSSL